MSFLSTTGQRATYTAENPEDFIAQRAAYGAIVQEIARHLRKGTFKHGAESLRLLKRGAPFMAAGKSQLLQDVWVLYETAYKKGGFFVEFGAASGVTYSNSWLLEKQFGWSGILAEPNPEFRESLQANRTCDLAFECVWSRSGETIAFTCSDVGEHSGVGVGGGRQIDVPTISLNDLLVKHGAPTDIDYLSVDTEGSEFNILQAFDFDRWNVHLISVEHNERPDRRAIYDLLTAKGYKRRFIELSRCDDWYMREQAAPTA